MLLFHDKFSEWGSAGKPTGKDPFMGIGISILVLAIGAVLTFAINVEVTGVDLDVVGVVLMIVGTIGLLWALLTAASVGPFARR